MSEKYEEIMDKIVVTDEMRNRILKNMADASDKSNKRKNVNKWIGYLSVAACIVAIGIVVSVSPGLLRKKQTSDGINDTENMTSQSDTMTSDEMTISDIEEFKSLSDLNKKIGFEVSDVSGIPFDVTDTKYTSYWGYLAEIEYIGAEDSIIYRKANANEDISGDYNEYAYINTIDCDGINVTLKGTSDKYNLATWQKDNYSYSLYVESGADAATFENMIKSVD